jgi:hypothetical protein
MQGHKRKTLLMDPRGTPTGLRLGSREGTLQGDQARKNPKRERLRLFLVEAETITFPFKTMS